MRQTSKCNYITDYYQLIYKADIEFETNNFQKAFDYYQKAFNTCTPKNSIGYHEIIKFAEVCVVLKKNKLAIVYLELAINNGILLGMIQEKQVFTELLNSKAGLKLVERYDSLRSQYVKGIDLSLRTEIQNMMALDQRYRLNDPDWDKQDSIDDINTIRLIEIFEAYGYPNETILGNSSIDKKYTTVEVLLLHTDDSIRMNYFVPKLLEFIQGGSCPPYILGMIIDQYYLYNDKPQIYGTYRGKVAPYANMITDLKQVDKNRLSIGLPPLVLQEKKDSLIRLRYPHSQY
jgi:hypothetical protein